MAPENSSNNSISQKASKPSKKVNPIPLGGISLTTAEKDALRADLKAGMTEERAGAIRKTLREMGIEPKG